MAAVQPGGVQAAAAQSGVGLGSYPGKSLLKKGNDKKLPAQANPNVFVTLDKAYFSAEEPQPLFVRNWFIHRPFADKEKGKVIHPKYYKHLKNSCSAQPFGQTKNGLVSGRLACTSGTTEMLNKIGI